MGANHRPHSLALGMLLLSCSPLGCTKDFSAADCTGNGECPSGTACRRGQCGALCNDSGGCAPEEICLLGACAPRRSEAGDGRQGDPVGGDWTAGDTNAGDTNAGDTNAGDTNAGDTNTGDTNTGDTNTGDTNAGDTNAGDTNTGDTMMGDPVLTEWWYALGGSEFDSWLTQIPSNCGGSCASGLFDGSFSNSGDAPTLAIVPSTDAVVIGWTVGSIGEDQIHLKRWQTDTWDPVGSSTPLSDAPTGKWAHDADVIIATSDIVVGYVGTSDLFVDRYSSAWSRQGGNWTTPEVLPAATTVTGASFGHGAEPGVAWSDGTSVFFREREAASWVGRASSDAAGGISGTTYPSTQPTLAYLAGAPYVAWVETIDGSNSKVLLKKLDGDCATSCQWIGLDGSDTDGVGWAGGDQVAEPRLLADGRGFVNLVWTRVADGNSRTVAMQYSTASGVWTALGDSLTTNGISGPGGNASEPSVAFNWHYRQPVVAWRHQPASGASEIYVRAFNGSDWVELDGSASGGGISRSDLPSRTPSIASAYSAASHRRDCVAWVENYDILLRCRDN